MTKIASAYNCWGKFIKFCYFYVNLFTNYNQARYTLELDYKFNYNNKSLELKFHQYVPVICVCIPKQDKGARNFSWWINQYPIDIEYGFAISCMFIKFLIICKKNNKGIFLFFRFSLSAWTTSSSSSKLSKKWKNFRARLIPSTWAACWAKPRRRCSCRRPLRRRPSSWVRSRTCPRSGPSRCTRPPRCWSTSWCKWRPSSRSSLSTTPEKSRLDTTSSVALRRKRLILLFRAEVSF